MRESKIRLGMSKDKHRTKSVLIFNLTYGVKKLADNDLIEKHGTGKSTFYTRKNI